MGATMSGVATEDPDTGDAVDAGDGAAGDFELDTQVLGALPVINAFIDQLGLQALLEEHLPGADGRLKLAPATAIGLVVRNLVTDRRPVYALGEWAAGFDPALLALAPEEAELLNDDRVGRCLGRLFDADRASLLTRLVLGAIDHFSIDCSQLHNDSTSIRFTGLYAGADGDSRGGKATAAITYGHSKDHRPDLKQLVWILTVSADGAVPIAYRAVDGNTTDDVTHVVTWDQLVALTGRANFRYVADSKLATRTNMDHIAGRGGRFVSVLPASRKEDRQFRDWIADHVPDWVEAIRRPARRHHDPDDVWDVTEAPWPSAEGYRIVWVRASAKTARDAEARRDRIARTIAALDDLNQRLASPKRRIRTTVAVTEAAEAALAKTGAGRWVSFEVTEEHEEHYHQEKRGRPGKDTRYRKTTRLRHRIDWMVDETQVAHDAASDGCFPLITNDRQMSSAEVLTAYKYQPNLEKRHAHLKGTQHVAPMFLRDPARIEALLCCHFIAMLIQALIERQIRTAMAAAGLPELSLYPEDRGCAAPTAARVLQIFHGLARHHLRGRDGTHLQTFQPALTDLQHQVLNLLEIPHTAYTTLT
ncbi:MAG: IS1634 family transposase [Jiangellaceae bacterium]